MFNKPEEKIIDFLMFQKSQTSEGLTVVWQVTSKPRGRGKWSIFQFRESKTPGCFKIVPYGLLLNKHL
jgi:hypothetical protein